MHKEPVRPAQVPPVNDAGALKNKNGFDSNPVFAGESPPEFIDKDETTLPGPDEVAAEIPVFIDSDSEPFEEVDEDSDPVTFGKEELPKIAGDNDPSDPSNGGGGKDDVVYVSITENNELVIPAENRREAAQIAKWLELGKASGYWWKGPDGQMEYVQGKVGTTALEYNTRVKWSKELLLKLLKISGDKHLYDKALKAGRVGPEFVALVFAAQMVLFYNNPMEWDGKLGPKTETAMTNWFTQTNGDAKKMALDRVYAHYVIELNWEQIRLREFQENPEFTREVMTAYAPDYRTKISRLADFEPFPGYQQAKDEEPTTEEKVAIIHASWGLRSKDVVLDDVVRKYSYGYENMKTDRSWTNDFGLTVNYGPLLDAMDARLRDEKSTIVSHKMWVQHEQSPKSLDEHRTTIIDNKRWFREQALPKILPDMIGPYLDATMAYEAIQENGDCLASHEGYLETFHERMIWLARPYTDHHMGQTHNPYYNELGTVHQVPKLVQGLGVDPDPKETLLRQYEHDLEVLNQILTDKAAKSGEKELAGTGQYIQKEDAFVSKVEGLHHSDRHGPVQKIPIIFQSTMDFERSLGQANVAMPESGEVFSLPLSAYLETTDDESILHVWIPGMDPMEFTASGPLLCMREFAEANVLPDGTLFYMHPLYDYFSPVPVKKGKNWSDVFGDLSLLLLVAGIILSPVPGLGAALMYASLAAFVASSTMKMVEAHQRGQLTPELVLFESAMILMAILPVVRGLGKLAPFAQAGRFAGVGRFLDGHLFTYFHNAVMIGGTSAIGITMTQAVADQLKAIDGMDISEEEKKRLRSIVLTKGMAVMAVSLICLKVSMAKAGSLEAEVLAAKQAKGKNPKGGAGAGELPPGAKGAGGRGQPNPTVLTRAENIHAARLRREFNEALQDLRDHWKKFLGYEVEIVPRAQMIPVGRGGMALSNLDNTFLFAKKINAGPISVISDQATGRILIEFNGTLKQLSEKIGTVIKIGIKYGAFRSKAEFLQFLRNKGVSYTAGYEKIWKEHVAKEFARKFGQQSENQAAKSVVDQCDEVISNMTANVTHVTKGTGAYSKVKGHHVMSKNNFADDLAYDPQAAFCVSDNTLKEAWKAAHPGKPMVKNPHSVISGRQSSLYSQFAKTGQKLSIAKMADIEVKAMVQAGIPEDIARGWVVQGMKDLRNQGVTRITNIYKYGPNP